MKSFFKVSIFTVAVFAVLVSFATAFCTEKSEENPVFFVKEKEIDVGQIYEGKDVNYDFIVENHGHGELHITRVRAG